jgi:hypothetical protein
MPALLSPLRRVGRLLVQHIRRLRQALEHLSSQVRSAVARVIGQATGDAVRDAIGVILDGPRGRLTSDHLLDNREGLWGEPRPSQRPSSSYQPYDPYEAAERYPEPDYRQDNDGELTETENESDEPAPPARPSVWSRAVATGCQAAAWWLHHHPGPCALVIATGVGLAAGVAALFGGPFVAGASVVAASALSVLALTDAARSAATLADVAVT